MTGAGAHANHATTDMDLRFLMPCLSDLTARARIIKLGRSLCPVAVGLYDNWENKVAIAQVTYMILGEQK